MLLAEDLRAKSLQAEDLSARGGMLTVKRTSIGRVCQMQFPSRTIFDRNGGVCYPFSRAGSLANRFQLVVDWVVGTRSREAVRRDLFIRCSITVPVPDEPSCVTGEEVSKHSATAMEIENAGREPIKAAFFDVDGTITRTNTVMAYFCIRMAELSSIKKLLWIPWFVLSCILYLLVDTVHRPTFNRIFYSSYKGRRTESKKAIANLVFESYYKPRIMAGAVKQILELKQLGYHIVFVTGALDFQIAPLAELLGADYVYAAKLVEENGRFTGRLHGMAKSNKEKAERIWDYAEINGVSLQDSLAFGDSIADMEMLEVVGKPYAVNPDARLQSIALKRGWSILNWKVNTVTDYGSDTSLHFKKLNERSMHHYSADHGPGETKF